ncbi:DUF5000 domain-containing lipoprotein [Wenyingzhuangia sp. 2_MG-2023]|uniref:DUF5000 domain-containing lipoprotein n=1 Tax=Wenyingzhuangia sp. 2_MG-2023 TaxID=3062639 RepID=UPI0026E39259|nr:DUF5000 domain-containing lipoprotein [Wenyingzhuangia sp. 2_MG-2023]MDO6738744.1 DUF4959 domain-containing protein [Wenyingzhuangia sp. 2_MG-2023]MDO6802006.1 DUF4959 domain-containing protein [Wenyingzhuangia sp. 1_MG-2023]
MKNRFIVMSLCSALLFSCQEDTVRSLVANDGKAPGLVENVMVENLAGSAKLTYNLPSDNDLLYVEAEFKRQSTGEVSRVRSSLFNNNLTVQGFGEEKEYEVSLFTVDQSENRSESVTTIINPEKAPYKYVAESLRAFADFGGIHIYWENPYESNVSIEISAINEFGVPEVVTVLYTSEIKDDFAVRGFDTTERTFQIIVKDRYDNIAEAEMFTVSPLFEEYLDKVNYKAIVQPHDTPEGFGWVLSRLYDGLLNKGYLSLATWTDPLGGLPEYEGQNVPMFTLDLGVKAKISRIKWFQRQNSGNDYIYANGNPKNFDIWGSNKLNPDGSLDGWVKIVENGEIIKPSGLPLGTFTTEDLEAAALGHDATADASAEPIRYIRWVNKLNWAGTTFMHIMELEAYGQIVE